MKRLLGQSSSLNSFIFQNTHVLAANQSHVCVSICIILHLIFLARSSTAFSPRDPSKRLSPWPTFMLCVGHSSVAFFLALFQAVLSARTLHTFHISFFFFAPRKRRRPNICLTCNSGPKGLAWFVPSEATSTNHDNRNCQVELVVRCLHFSLNKAPSGVPV